ncbi:hypothetical protein EC973_000321 [Apophysomyces ossiformis]|uniref:Sodium/calcium exchanger membrane region domain-containing protein n=1 Tax=Apophysomyces ossiformis TaxID=679940 RepID=A0A8H7BLT0_9FUNG|nr:hypothetical protein EC973_000321 [Apophysomyces ossiformis]
MDSGSGSLAIGELIGAAFFIVSVVSGCMGIIRPFQSRRITFMRDASFLTGAIAMMTWIVYHRRICWYHGVALIAYYLTYVFVVAFGAYRFPDADRAVSLEHKSTTIKHSTTEEQLTETSRLLPERNVKPPRLSIPEHGFLEQSDALDREQHLGHVIRPVSPNSSFRSSLHIDTLNVPRTTSTNGSISARLYRYPMTPRIGIRTSLFSAIEFREQVSAIRRANSSRTIERPGRRREASMPPRIWNGSSQSSFPFMMSRYRGRPRSSTIVDHLAITDSMYPPSSEGTEAGSGPPEDYFSFISRNQNHQTPIDRVGELHPSYPSTDSPEHLRIPEIRLAPPNGGQDTSLQPHDVQNNSQCISPISANRRSLGRGNITCKTDRRTQDAIRPPAEISPSLTSLDQDRRSISIALPVPDHEETRGVPKPHDFIHDDLSKGMLTMGIFSVPANIYLIGQEVWQTLFPTLQDWEHKTLFSKLSSMVAAPLVLFFTLTLPVAECEDIKVDDIEVIDDEPLLEDTSPGRNGNYLTVPPTQAECMEDGLSVIDEGIDVHREWCQWLVAIQAIFATTFVASVLALNGVMSTGYITIGIAFGCVIAAIFLASTRADQPPQWFWMLSFVGFAISLNWIFLLANEIVGLLQAFGTIFHISDAIMGLTIFAVGNSIGDLVANTAIAKMGFPTMAISACYAGPLLSESNSL